MRRGGRSKLLKRARVRRGGVLLIALLTACTDGRPLEESAPGDEHEEGGSEHSNRLEVSSTAIANLGMTFATVTRGKVGSWLSVPGELYVPEDHRWTLRASAHGVLTKVAARWKLVESGETVAEILSPEVGKEQLGLLEAQSLRERAAEEAEAAAQRLEESETQLAAARELAQISSKRLRQLESLRELRGTLAPKELLDVQRTSLDAAKVALEIALRRDQLRAAARDKKLLLDQAVLRFEQRLAAFSVMSGREVAALLEERDGKPLWRTLSTILVRAPSRAYVTEVRVAFSERVAHGAPLLVLLDPAGMRFRGWVPEGDLTSLRADAMVRVRLPGDLATVETRLLGPRTVGDRITRRVQIEADIPNPTGVLPEGLSATALVRVAESQHDEVLVAEECVVPDGLETIVFRRDPDHPSTIIRTPVELGLRGGGQVEVLAGLFAGDFVVREGVYQLKRSMSGSAPSGGHVHADGTWHENHGEGEENEE